MRKALLTAAILLLLLVFTSDVDIAYAGDDDRDKDGKERADQFADFDEAQKGFAEVAALVDQGDFHTAYRLLYELENSLQRHRARKKPLGALLRGIRVTLRRRT